MALFGSSSPFGASTATLFGGASPSSNPFSTTPSSPFGVSQGPSLFGAKPFGSPTFGTQTGSSFFGGTATGVFGATQASLLGSTTPAFGASSTPAFGTTPSPFGSGTSLFGQKPPTSFGGFGSTSGQANPFGTTPFGQTPTFGSTPFGSSTPAAFGASSTPAFGATSTPAFGMFSAPAFGASSTPAFGASSTPAFGMSSTPAFGASSTPAFGAASTPAFGVSSTPLFGSTTPAFGQTSAFGNISTPAFGTSVFGSATTASPFGVQSTPASAFGSSPTFGSSAFGAQKVGSRVTPYSITTDAEAGVSSQIGRLMSICAMPSYKGKSVEELRWEDYQAGDKGGPSAPGQQTTTGLFGQSSPFGGSSLAFSTPTSNPFGSPTTTLFGSKPGGSFGIPTTGSAATTTPSLFGQPSTGSAFGQVSSGGFGLSLSSPFGAASMPSLSPAFGSTSSFASPSSAFSSGAGFSAPGLFNTGTSAFGSSPFGQSQTTTSLFSTPSQPFGSMTGSVFSISTLGSTPFGSSSSLFSNTKPAGLSLPMSSLGGFGTTSGGFGYGGFSSLSQPGTTAFGASTFPGASGVTQLPIVYVPVTNPFGVLPAIPQMSIGRSAGTGPSVQYGISSIPVSERPAQVRTMSLLTPRHITQRSRVRMQARHYTPKKDGPKMSFFSDECEEVPNTPKADALFVPRENPRALLIRQPERTSTTGAPKVNIGEMATPVKQTGAPSKRDGMADVPTSPQQATDGSLPQESSRPAAGSSEEAKMGGGASSPFSDSAPMQNGVEHRRNGYISMKGHKAGEAAVAYEHGADIEALMPKLRHTDYYIQPRVQELAAKERAEPGYCRHVKDFVVGRHAYGYAKFLGETDVRGLDLESIIQFNKCEVLVYMDESKKPPPGVGLNKPAEITLLNVKCVDKKTGQHHSEGLEVEKFEKRLKKKTEDQGAEFMSYDAVKGEWKFRVKHFSRYGSW